MCFDLAQTASRGTAYARACTTHTQARERASERALAEKRALTLLRSSFLSHRSRHLPHKLQCHGRDWDHLHFAILEILVDDLNEAGKLTPGCPRTLVEDAFDGALFTSQELAKPEIFLFLKPFSAYLWLSIVGWFLLHA
jgi:hypothetical protein